MLDGLSSAVSRVRIDLHDYPETYYFREPETRASLPSALPVAARLASVAIASPDPHLRHGGAMLEAALDDLAMVLATRFDQSGGTTRDVLDAFRADHRAGTHP